MHTRRSATTAGQALKFAFPVKGQKFLVKNFTDGKIYVSLGYETRKSHMTLIQAGTAEVVTRPERDSDQHATNTVIVIPETTSEEGVEVGRVG